MNSKEIVQMQAIALAEDENIFDYDGAYDSFKKKVSFVYFFIFRIDILSVHLSILLL